MTDNTRILGRSAGSGHNQIRLVALILAAVLSGFVFLSDSRTGIGLFCVVVGIAMFFLLQIRARRPLPLGGLAVLAITFCFALGYIYYPSIQYDALVSYEVPNGEAIYIAALRIFSISIFSIFVGAIVFSRKVDNVFLNQKSTARGNRGPMKNTGILLIAGVLPLLLYVVGFGISGLLERGHYLENSGFQAGVSAGSLTAPIGIGIVTMVLFSPRVKALHALAALILSACYFLVLFSVGSRSIALIPLATLWVYIEKRTKK